MKTSLGESFSFKPCEGGVAFIIILVLQALCVKSVMSSSQRLTGTGATPLLLGLTHTETTPPSLRITEANPPSLDLTHTDHAFLAETQSEATPLSQGHGLRPRLLCRDIRYMKTDGGHASFTETDKWSDTSFTGPEAYRDHVYVTEVTPLY